MPFWIALVGSVAGAVFRGPVAASGLAAGWTGAVERMEIFTGMLVYDRFTVYHPLAPAAVRRAVRRSSRSSPAFPTAKTAPTIYTLVLGATLGMCLMASANHLLMVFLAVEMASVPSYALAGMLKGRRQSSEAALKYAVYGAGAAGVMLYGISLLAGVLGTCPSADHGRCDWPTCSRAAGVRRAS